MSANEATYGKKQTLVIQNIRDLATKVPSISTRISDFMQKELGIAERVVGSPGTRGMPPTVTNVFDAIDIEIDKLRDTINALSSKVDSMINCINPVDGPKDSKE